MKVYIIVSDVGPYDGGESNSDVILDDENLAKSRCQALKDEERKKKYAMCDFYLQIWTFNEGDNGVASGYDRWDPQ